MPFNRPTLSEIIDRMEADVEQRLTGNTPLLTVSFLRVLVRVFAGAIHVVYGWLVWLADQLFWDTAETSMLDRHARLWGLSRKAATFAIGNITFVGSNGTAIPSGTLLVTEDNIQFETTAPGTIVGGSTTVTATASEPGEAGNISTGTDLELVEPISGIQYADANGDFSGGQDQESDNDLRNRIDARITTPPAGGTATDFENWALSVDGVADAWAFGNTPSIGYVTLIIKASGSNPVPSAPLLTDVENYVSTVMPVTTNLLVQAIDDKTIDLTIDITLAAGADQSDTEAAITSNLQSFFEDAAEPGEDVLISQLRNAISTTGVEDYEITDIDKDSVAQPIDDISMSGFEYAILGSITYT